MGVQLHTLHTHFHRPCIIDMLVICDKEEREKNMVMWYILHEYDPRKIYEPEEYMYREAVRIMEPVDLKLGIIKLLSTTPR